VFEETFKTGAALFFNVSIPATHILFGLVEAVYDYAWGERKKVLAGIFGVLFHTVFGLITYFLVEKGLSLYLGVAGAIAVHIALNMAVVKISGMECRRNNI
jgi:hypothetical protein